MARFRGQYTHAMDKKGRVSIPVRFRETLRIQYDEQLILCLSHECLVAYPVKVWEELEDSLQQFPRFSPVVKDYKRVFMSAAQECPLDSQGRILIPPELRTRASLENKVFFVGMINHFEIWDRERYMQKYEPMREDIPELEEQMSRLPQDGQKRPE